jgi:hypothetical protein
MKSKKNRVVTDVGEIGIRFVRVSVDGEIMVHALDASGNYATLCGIDGNDNHPSCTQKTLGHLKRGKIDCPECRLILKMAWRYSERDLY